MSRSRRLFGALLVTGTVAAAGVAGLSTGAVAAVTSGPPARLAAVGPVDPVTGFPAWYRDSNQVTLTPCVDGTDPYCGLVAGVMPDPTQPTVFPTNFPTESFYASAGARIALPGGGTAELVTGLEAAFATGRATPGQQVTFGRVRIRIDTPAGGRYTVTHPFGVDTFDVPAAGTRTINYTEDIGLGAAGFAGALGARTNPFLSWDDGPIHAANGNTYLGDPAVLHKVTGSALGTNFFRVEGSGLGTTGSVQTDLFTVTGKVATRLGVDAGTPTYTATSSGTSVDVFAGSDPGQVLTLTGAGLSPTTLRGDGTGRYFGRAAVTGAPPAEVTVTNTSDRPATAVTTKLVDRVVVGQADYDADRRILTVQAASSDTLDPPGLSADGFGPLDPAGHAVFSGVDAPPATLTVLSGHGGRGGAPVQVTGAALTADAVTAVAGPDQTVAQGAAVTLTGAASQNATGYSWVQTGGTPAVALAGADTPTASFTAPAQGGTLTFRLTTQGPGGPATDDVAVTVTEVAPPVAAAGADQTPLFGDVVTLDGSGSTGATSYSWTQAGVPADAPKLLAGADTAHPTFTLRTTDALAFDLTVTGPGGTAHDTVVVTAQPDPISVTAATYRTGKREWRISGTAGVRAGNSVTVYVGSTFGGTSVGTSVVDTTGAWAVRLQGSNVVPDAGGRISVVSVRGGRALGTVAIGR